MGHVFTRTFIVRKLESPSYC